MRKLIYCKDCRAYLDHTFGGLQDAEGTRFHNMQYYTCSECHTTISIMPDVTVEAYNKQRRMGAVDALKRSIRGQQ